jgi:hypothetical protein
VWVNKAVKTVAIVAVEAQCLAQRQIYRSLFRSLQNKETIEQGWYCERHTSAVTAVKVKESVSRSRLGVQFR